jgi:hypothetical protein
MRSPSASPRSSARPSQSSRPRTRLSEHATRRAVRRRDMVVLYTDGLIDQGHRNRRGLHGAVLASRRLERWHRRRTQRGRRQTKGRGKEMVEGPPRPVGHRVVDLDASTSRTARLAGAPRFAGARPGPGKRSGVRHLDGRWPAVTLTRGIRLAQARLSGRRRDHPASLRPVQAGAPRSRQGAARADRPAPARSGRSPDRAPAAVQPCDESTSASSHAAPREAGPLGRHPLGADQRRRDPHGTRP